MLWRVSVGELSVDLFAQMSPSGTWALVQGCCTSSISRERCFLCCTEQQPMDGAWERLPENPPPAASFALCLPYSTATCLGCYWLHVVPSSPTVFICIYVCTCICIWPVACGNSAVCCALQAPGERRTQKSVAQIFTMTVAFPLLSHVQVRWLLSCPAGCRCRGCCCCPDFTVLEPQAGAPQGFSSSPHVFPGPNSPWCINGCRSIKDAASVCMPCLGLNILPFPKFIKVGIKISAVSASGGKSPNAWPNKIQQT